MQNSSFWQTTRGRSIIRLVWLVLAGVVNGTIIWLTKDWANAAWYPFVYWAITTLRDFLNKKISN